MALMRSLIIAAPVVVIRAARADELDAARTVMLDAFAPVVPADRDATPAVRDAFARHRADLADVRSRLGRADLLVADEGGQVAGAVTLFRPAAAEAPWPGGWASIRFLAVDPARRGRGIGRALTAACIEGARQHGAPVLALHTTRDQPVARAMYLRMGWVRAPSYDLWPLPQLHVEAFVLDLMSST